MARKRINVVLVLDETGSMYNFREDVVGGYNGYIETLQKDKDAIYRFTLIQFNSTHQTVVHDSLNILDVPKLTNATYRPDALTPLYDAIAKGFEYLKGKKNVFFAIQTDGFENASTKHTRQDIFKLIEEKTAKGWQFVFLGAGQDAWITGEAIGMARGQTFSYDPDQTQRGFTAMAVSSKSYAANPVQSKNPFVKTDIRKKK